MTKWHTILVSVILVCGLLVSASSSSVKGEGLAILDPSTIPKWVNQLEGPPPVYVPTNVVDGSGKVIRQDYLVNITEFYEQILPTVNANGDPTGFGETKVYGYGGIAQDAVTGQNLGFVRNTPGPSFEVTRNIPARVTWANNLLDDSGNPLPSLLAVDPTLEWANPNSIDKITAKTQASQGLAPQYPPGYNGTQQVLSNGTVANPNAWNAQSPIPIVTHLHGGETPSSSDGIPDAWYTPNGIHGPAYSSIVTTDPNAAVYDYPNAQQATTLWYHDHAMGMTRLNVMSGLAGFYLIRDPADAVAPALPQGKYEMPLAIQDRSFLTDGSIYYPSNGSYPDTNPYWQNMFLGNTIMVNGKVWPNMNVDRAQYRLRILDGSNSAPYNLTFSNGMTFTLIGTDGGYAKTPVQLTSIVIGAAERADIIVDFSNLVPGEKIVLQNNNIPALSPTQILAVNEIMQFTANNQKGPTPFNLNNVPNPFNPTLSSDTFPTLSNATTQRTLTLIQNMGNNGAQIALLDGQSYNSPVSENPQIGTTEDWLIVNPTMDSHPIHSHLVQFQLVQRQTIDANGYINDWTAINGIPPLNHTTRNLPSLAPYLVGSPTPPEASEQGWKDTIIAYSGEAMTIRIRFTQQDGSIFPFDAAAGPGYVWHCHILEHEDNQMMRPLMLSKAATQPSKPFSLVIPIIAAVVLVASLVTGIVRYRRQSNDRRNNGKTKTPTRLITT